MNIQVYKKIYYAIFPTIRPKDVPIIHNYGITHLVIIVGVMLITHYIFSSWFSQADIIAGIITSNYYTYRESIARKDKFKQWYLDSKLDCLLPLLGVIVYLIVKLTYL